MGTAAKTTKKSGLKTFNSQKEWEDAVNDVMEQICLYVLSDAPDSFDVKGRFERGDDPATTARAAYDAIEG